MAEIAETPTRFPMTRNVLSRLSHFRASHMNDPKFLALDRASYTMLRDEVQSANPHWKRRVDLRVIFGLQIVVIDEIPELCVVLANPEVEPIG